MDAVLTVGIVALGLLFTVDGVRAGRESKQAILSAERPPTREDGWRVLEGMRAHELDVDLMALTLQKSPQWVREALETVGHGCCAHCKKLEPLEEMGLDEDGYFYSSDLCAECCDEEAANGAAPEGYARCSRCRCVDFSFHLSTQPDGRTLCDLCAHDESGAAAL